MTEQIENNRVVSIIVESISKAPQGWQIDAQVPIFDSQYPTKFNRVPAEIAEAMTPLGTYLVEIVRENLKRDKDGGKDWHYYWGLKKFADKEIDADDAYHLGLGPDPEADGPQGVTSPYPTYVEKQIAEYEKEKNSQGIKYRDPTRSSIEHQKSLDLAGRDYWKAIEYKIIEPPEDARTVMYQIKLCAYHYDRFLVNWVQPEPLNADDEDGHSEE